MVSIKVTSNGGLQRFTKKIQHANLSKTAAELYVECLKTAINQRVSQGSTGNLADSVKAVKRGNNKYGVVADYYFWYANYGREPGKPPGKRVAKLDAWAISMGIPPQVLREHIQDFGTSPRLFYESAKKMFKTKKPRIYKDIKKK